MLTTAQDLLEQSSADDVQIDIDVPRTINSHIMFRRRYRGGYGSWSLADHGLADSASSQRLLFRVLHALSLYFPDTGYVQGMAALAATLLCYYDEESSFVMLVRLWQLRGLQRLYQPGFDGLMDTLGEFERDWLGDEAVAKKLVRLSPPLTRWLTVSTEGNGHRPDGLRHAMVPDAVQPQHSFFGAVARVGCVHAPGR